MSRMYSFRGTLVFALGLTCLAAPSFSAPASSNPAPAIPSSVSDLFEASVVADGLSSPDGLAVNPLTGELYVSEESAGRVSVIRDGKAVPVIERDFTVLDDLPEWAMSDYKPRAAWLKPELTSPEGIAFSSDGRLFVAEDTPYGRVLEFAPDADGAFRHAHAIPVPWLEQPFAWEGIVVAKDGRLFLAGSCAEAGSGLPYGTVLVRDVDGVWSVVDYGPFASFSAVCLSREEDILVVGEETPAGGVTWWDAVRRLPIRTAIELLPSVEGLCVLPDGAILAAQEEQPGQGGGRLVRIDPRTGASEPAAGGFGTIESVISTANGSVYLTEDGAGRVLELRPKRPFAESEYLLQRSVSGYEVSQGLAPKRWPTFLRQFFKDLGVSPRDETVYAEKKPKPPPKAKTGESELAVTLQELGSRIPLIAGKLKTSPIAGKQFEDPIEEMNFIVFFPNQMLRSGICTPSLSLFTARRASGKTEKTQVLGGMASAARRGAGDWSRECENAHLYLPLTTCSAMRTPRGTEVTLTFLGMDVTDDYYLHILLGSENRGELMMKDSAGEMSGYDVDVTEFDERGTERVNIVVTGFGTRSERNEMWLDIGDRPSWGLIKDMRRARWVSYWVSRQAQDLIALLAKKDEEWGITEETGLVPKPDLEASVPAAPTARAEPPPPAQEPGREAAAPKPASEPPLAGTPAPARHQEASARPPAPDLTKSDAAPRPPDKAGEPSWTNVLLSRAISLWNQRAF